jgi:hypothetical protein
MGTPKLIYLSVTGDPKLKPFKVQEAQSRPQDVMERVFMLLIDNIR